MGDPFEKVWFDPDRRIVAENVDRVVNSAAKPAVLACRSVFRVILLPGAPKCRFYELYRLFRLPIEIVRSKTSDAASIA
jgi:hypothetical protein